MVCLDCVPVASKFSPELQSLILKNQSRQQGPPGSGMHIKLESFCLMQVRREYIFGCPVALQLLLPRPCLPDCPSYTVSVRLSELLRPLRPFIHSFIHSRTTISRPDGLDLKSLLLHRT